MGWGRQASTLQELLLLKSCLKPLGQREQEKRGSVEESLAPIEQRAPLRIYGK